MITNILYSIFFFVLNLTIFLIFIKSYRIDNRLILSFIVFVLLGLTIQGIYDSKLKLSTNDFSNLMFFSGALIIIHFATAIQINIFKKQNVEVNELNQTIKQFALKVFDLMRKKLFYIMIFIYQLLYIWSVDFR